jgi:hypothetical protein
MARKNSHIVQYARRKNGDPNRQMISAMAADKYMFLIHSPASADVGSYNSRAYGDRGVMGFLYTPHRLWLVLAVNRQRQLCC